MHPARFVFSSTDIRDRSTEGQPAISLRDETIIRFSPSNRVHPPVDVRQRHKHSAVESGEAAYGHQLTVVLLALISDPATARRISDMRLSMKVAPTRRHPSRLHSNPRSIIHRWAVRRLGRSPVRGLPSDSCPLARTEACQSSQASSVDVLGSLLRKSPRSRLSSAPLSTCSWVHGDRLAAVVMECGSAENHYNIHSGFQIAF